ncbi:hypothetical protein B0H13DRAFT_2302630 [Mycena leptocephala]|nr:hypothetical protein B0H13DRAFT_2302630 [Mycena leptocephala]
MPCIQKSGLMVGTTYLKFREILFIDTISTIDKLSEHRTAPLRRVSSLFLPILFVNTLYTSSLPSSRSLRSSRPLLTPPSYLQAHDMIRGITGYGAGNGPFISIHVLVEKSFMLVLVLYLGLVLVPAIQTWLQPVPAAVQSALSDCELIVGEYRKQRITKAKALHEIYQKPLAAGTGSPLDIEGSFSSFLKALDDHALQEQGAADRGHGRPLAPGRVGAFEAQCPWVVADVIQTAIEPLSPNLEETLRILRILLQDPKAAKRSILTSARCPEFPDAPSSWTNVLTGRPVSLDNVLSGMSSTSTVDERTESLGGGLELRFGLQQLEQALAFLRN